MFIESLLPDLYGAAQQPQQWLPVLDQLKQQAGAANVAVQLFQRNGDRLTETWTARDSASTDMSEWHDQVVNNADNPRLDASYLVDLPPVMVYHEPDSSPHEPEDFRLLRERLAMIGLGRSISVTMDLGADSYLSMILHRPLERNICFDTDTAELLTRLAPHLRQTVSLQQQLGQLQQQQQLLTGTLNSMKSNTILLASNGRVEWFNQAACQLLEQSLLLQLQHGRLRCRYNSDQQRLQQLLERAATRGEAEAKDNFSRLDGGGGDPLYVRVRRLPQTPLACISNEPVLLLNLSDGGDDLALNQSGIQQDVICSVFGLTPAEARLTESLCHGFSLQDHADLYQVSVGTCRIQLKSIFFKLGINRQADLVSLITRTVAALG